MEFKKSSMIIWTKRIIPLTLGAAGGYLYYSFIGCVTGACPITGNPWSSTIVGILIGAAFIPNTKSKKEKSKVK